MQSASYGSQHLQMLQCPISNSDVYQGLQHMTQLQPQADETLSSDATLMAAAAGGRPCSATQMTCAFDAVDRFV